MDQDLLKKHTHIDTRGNNQCGTTDILLEIVMVMIIIMKRIVIVIVIIIIINTFKHNFKKHYRNQ